MYFYHGFSDVTKVPKAMCYTVLGERFFDFLFLSLNKNILLTL